jgi:ABC-type amino acid transport substrate-binding protein
MKILSTFLFLLITVGNVLAQSPIKGQSWAQVKANKTGNLTCVYYKTPGLVFEQGGKMQGVCVDLMEEFKGFVKDKYAVELSFSFTKKIDNFSNFINTVKVSDNIMGVCNTSITNERKTFLSFTPPYMNNPSVLLSNNDAEKISSLDEMSTAFKDYKAVVIKGSTHEKYLNDIKGKYFSNLQIEMVNSGPEVIAKLKSGQNYFTLIDFTEYYDSVKKRLPITRHLVNLNELEDQLGFIFPKGSDWASVWAEFLTPEYKNSVAYKRIIADNLGTSFVNLIK